MINRNAPINTSSSRGIPVSSYFSIISFNTVKFFLVSSISYMYHGSLLKMIWNNSFSIFSPKCSSSAAKRRSSFSRYSSVPPKSSSYASSFIRSYSFSSLVIIFSGSSKPWKFLSCFTASVYRPAISRICILYFFVYLNPYFFMISGISSTKISISISNPLSCWNFRLSSIILFTFFFINCW